MKTLRHLTDMVVDSATLTEAIYATDKQATDLASKAALSSDVKTRAKARKAAADSRQIVSQLRIKGPQKLRTLRHQRQCAQNLADLKAQPKTITTFL